MSRQGSTIRLVLPTLYNYGSIIWLLTKLGMGKWEMGNTEMKKRGNDLEMVDYCIQLQQKILIVTKNKTKQKQMFQLQVNISTSSVDNCSSS